MQPARPIVPYAPTVTLAWQALLFLAALPRVRLSLSRKALAFPALWAALFGWSLLSLFWSRFPLHTAQYALLVFLPAGALLLLVYGDPRPVETFWRFTRALAFFGAALAGAGLILYIFGDVLPMDEWEGWQVLRFGPLQVSQVVHTLGPRLRISSFAGNPNVLAVWLFISLLCTLALSRAGRLSTPCLAALAGLQLPALALTMSRTGIGALLWGGALFCLATPGSPGGRAVRGALLALAAGAAVLLILAGQPAALALGGDFLAGPATLLTGREEAWALAWQTFLQRPLAGGGFAVTTVALLQEAGIDLIHIHNAFLGVLAETGLVGFGLFLALWALALAAAAGRGGMIRGPAGDSGDGPNWSHDQRRLALLAAFALLGAFALHQLFESLVLRTHCYTLLWVYLAAFATHPQLQN